MPLSKTLFTKVIPLTLLVLFLVSDTGSLSGLFPAALRASSSQAHSAKQQAPQPDDGTQPSLYGSYLAARIALAHRDHKAAARYYSKALKRDPGNANILEQTFLLEVILGDWARAEQLAHKVIRVSPKHHIAYLVLATEAFKAGQYEKAKKLFKKSGSSDVMALISTLARGWTTQAEGNSRQALKLLKTMNASPAIRNFADYHSALIADLDGRYNLAGNIFDRMFKKDPLVLRVTLAYARHAWRGGKTILALRILRKHKQAIKRSNTLTLHPLVKELETRIRAGEQPELLVRSAREGLAEVYYGIGEALASGRSLDIGTMYLQLALWLRPDFPLAKTALAEIYEQTGKYDEANQLYATISDKSPLWDYIVMRQANNLNRLKKVQLAKTLLDKAIARNPGRLTLYEMQGRLLLAAKRYKEAVDYYTKAIALIKKPKAEDWVYYYSRGVSYERLHDWDKAETDFLMALKLKPEEPMTLNYLGYSWVDQNKHIKRALNLIKQAVRLRPNDGYYIDSLGWAYYKLGRYPEGVTALERAVEKRPDDPIINDHLGDAYWRVGRKREARFQWLQALDLKPEPKDAVKIRAKLEQGLEQPVPPAAQASKKQAVKKKVTRRKISRRRNINKVRSRSGKPKKKPKKKKQPDWYYDF